MMMGTMPVVDTIQQQYDEVIAAHYDQDPQAVTGATLDRAITQIRQQVLDGGTSRRLRVYDVGMGTGMFLVRLRALADIEPYGLDLSQKMIDCAYPKLPDLQGAVDNAENLGAHFPDQEFDLIATHFISGFVGLDVLAPRVYSRLVEGGYWSYLGATKQAYPHLQASANNKLLRWLFNAPKLDLDKQIHSPANPQEVDDILERHGFVVRQRETFQPKLRFRDLDEFLAFAYYGGWLTPFIESVGLHKAGALMRFFLNRVFFPMEDHHSVAIHLAQKISR